MKTLRAYQQKSLKIFSRDTSCLDASELGTGKTLVAVERLRTLPYTGAAPRVLVVAPGNTHRQWMNAFAEQYPALKDSPYLRCIGTPKGDPKAWSDFLLKKRPGIYIIGWEAMRGSTGEALRRASHAAGTNKLTVAALNAAMKQGDIPPWNRTGTWDLVIADEVHRICRRDSANAMVLKKIKAHHKHGMSATPSGNKETGLWSVLNWLWPKEHRSFWNWAHTYLVIEDVAINRTDTVQQIGGEKEPGATWIDIPCKVRHRVDTVRPELPDVIERTVTIPMTDQQRAIYDEFADQALAWIDDHPVGAPLPITQRIRMRQAALGTLKITDAKKPNEVEIGFNDRAEQNKIKAIAEIIDDLPPDTSVMVWTHSARWAHIAAQHLNRAGYGPAQAWTGALTPDQREKTKAAFGNGMRIIVAQIQALAEGVDGLQHTRAIEIWASQSEDSLANEQAKGRLHRDGQQHVLQRWYLHSEDSIDTDVAASLERRRQHLRKMNRDKETR